MLNSLSTASLIAILTVLAGPLDAQRPRLPRVPVTVVMVDRLTQPDAAFLIQRRPHLIPHDVIVLRSDATPEQFSDAVRGLLTSRQAGGDSTATAATVRVRPRDHQPGRASESAARRSLPWAHQVLADLRRAEQREVAGIGRVRAVEIWLPRQGRSPRRR